jgi:hypothetical protein
LLDVREREIEMRLRERRLEVSHALELIDRLRVLTGEVENPPQARADDERQRLEAAEWTAARAQHGARRGGERRCDRNPISRPGDAVDRAAGALTDAKTLPPSPPGAAERPTSAETEAAVRGSSVAACRRRLLCGARPRQSPTPPGWRCNREEPVEAAGSVDAENAPTAAWKTHRTGFPRAPTGGIAYSEEDISISLRTGTFLFRVDTVPRWT